MIMSRKRDFLDAGPRFTPDDVICDMQNAAHNHNFGRDGMLHVFRNSAFRLPHN